MDKRFIEESFPVKEVGEESSREKRIRHGHISTLHLWWARRPLASSRATNYAALIPAPKDDIDWVKKRNFIIELSKWENSLDQNIIKKAKDEILEANGGKAPKILDPFSGGGAIPLEALRLGCETYANDYNPVAVLIEKCTLEYPQKYAHIKNKNWAESNEYLVDGIEKWGKLVLEEAEKEIGKFYPKEKDGSIPIGYIWSKTIKCQNPACNAEIPLMRQFWLAKNKNKKVALKPVIMNKDVSFEIVGQNKEIPNDFDPSDGTVKKAVVTCPICDSTIEADKTRELFQKGRFGERMIAVALSNPEKKGKTYRLATEKDLKTFQESEIYLKQKQKKMIDEWGIDPIPKEPLPPIGTLGFRIQKYGFKEWGDLFNSRQKLVLITFIEKIRNIYYEKKIDDDEFKKIIMTYLGLALDKLASFNTRYGFWLSVGEKATQIFARHAIPMLWDYSETNPFANSFGWKTQLKWMMKSVEHLTKTSDNLAKITLSSSTSMCYPDNFFDAVFTDPPYYDNVPYSYLSDFFYVLLKRNIGNLYPELFLTPLTPKKEEIVAYTHKSGGVEGGKRFFEENLKITFKEINRVLKPGGISTIVYAHKTTQGWETVINSLLDSGLTVTASWPLSTEMGVRLNARQTASLASSIYIVARKFEKTDIGWYKDVKEEIKEYVPQKLDKLWQEGISGADFFIAAIGSAIEIFGKYEKIMDNEGNEIRADKLLTFVREVVTDYAMHQILHNGTAAELSALSKFYLLWRWNYQELSVTFDEARKLAQSAGIDISQEWNRGFIVKRGDKISVQGPDKRDPKTLQEPIELIDVLHKVCLLWKAGKTVEMKQTMKKSGYANNDTFYKVAQAISETLHNSSSEKKLIEGFLAGKESIIKDDHEEKPQTTLI